MLKYSADGTVTSPAVLLSARRTIDLPVIIEDGGTLWTWAALCRYAEALAARLGNVSGERVTITAPNGGALIAAIFGTWLAGGAPAPLSYRLPPLERARVLRAIDATRNIVWADHHLDGDIQMDENTGLVAPAEGREPPIVSIHDPGIVLCTSGTTGQPKAVLHSVRAVWGMIDSVSRHVVDPDNLPIPEPAPPRRVEPKPLAHIGSLFGLMFDLWRGRSVVIMKRFEAHRFAELVRQYDVGLLSLAPSMIRMLLDSDVASLKPPAKLTTTGTAPLPVSWRNEFEQRFDVPIQVTYGQTESCGAIAYEPVQDVLSGNRRPGTAGQVVPQIQIEIRDQDGRPLPIGTDGQIWISGETLHPTMVGDRTNRVADGWLNTGDVGHLDADRYIYLTGRERELIIRGGLKVVPAEVEKALLEYPSIIEVAVAGRPDYRLGEVPVAWARTSRGTFDPSEVLRFLRDRLAAYKIPVAVYPVDEFPRTDTGKIRKQELNHPRPAPAAGQDEARKEAI